MLLAVGEICGIPVAVFVVAAWLIWHLYNEDQKSKASSGGQNKRAGSVFHSASWSGGITNCSLGIEVTQLTVRTFFCDQRGCRLLHATTLSQVFSRGDDSMVKMPTGRAVAWQEIPVTITVDYTVTDAGIDAELSFEAPREMEVDEQFLGFFERRAEAERDRLLQWLKTAEALARERESEPEYTSVGWSSQKTLRVPCDRLRPSIAMLYHDVLGCVLALPEEQVDLFGRGDPSIARLPLDRKVNWREIPVRIMVRYKAISDEKTTVKIVYAAPKHVAFDERSREFFLGQAEAEFSGVCELITRMVDESGQDETSQDGREPENADDYIALGLDNNATWGQVQAAYRQMCLKYHPDALAAQNLPAHIEQLAVEKFRGITEAYQRLKGNLNHSESD